MPDPPTLTRVGQTSPIKLQIFRSYPKGDIPENPEIIRLIQERFEIGGYNPEIVDGTDPLVDGIRISMREEIRYKPYSIPSMIVSVCTLTVWPTYNRADMHFTINMYKKGRVTKTYQYTEGISGWTWLPLAVPTMINSLSKDAKESEPTSQTVKLVTTTAIQEMRADGIL